MSDQVKIETISDSLALGEGPHWVEKDGSLLFVDILGGSVYRYFTDTKRLQILDIEDDGKALPAFIIPVKDSDNLFAIGSGHDLGIVEWRPSDPDRCSKKIEKVFHFHENHAGNRLNDAKVDPKGRLWTGTMGDHTGSASFSPNRGTLYRVDSALTVSEMVKEVGISNGTAWNLSKDTMYYIDSPLKSVDAFDYDDETGNINNRRVILNLEEAGLTGHVPDGMTIDSQGNLWVACYNGAKVVCIDPTLGRIIRTVETPSLYTTSCCFGGSDYSTLFVTSIAKNFTEEQMKECPDSGKTIAITGLGVKGFAPQEFKFDLRLLRNNSL